MAQHRENRSYSGARGQYEDRGGQRWRPGEHEESQRGANWGEQQRPSGQRGYGQDRPEDWDGDAWPSEAAGQGGPWASQGGYPGQGGGEYGSRGGHGQGADPGGYSSPGSQGRYGQGGYRRGGYGQGEYGQGGYGGGFADEYGGFGQGRSGPGSFGQGFSGGGYGQGSFGYGQGGGYGRGGYGQGGYGGQEWGSSQGSGTQQQWGRGPKGYKRSDERLKEDISERLMQSHQIDAGEVSVEVQSGKVTLDGTVPERRMKHMIEDLVDACPGVQDIDNRVRVARVDPGTSANDSGTGTGSTGGTSATGTYGATSSRAGTGSKKE